MSKNAFIFPGQGAQYIGMGKDFYEISSLVRETFEEASEILKIDLPHLIFKGSERELVLTKNSQLSIFVTTVAILRYLRLQFPPFQSFVCAGLSLGEYTALYASGRINFENSLRLIALRGHFMQEACLDREGAMAVVLGLDPNKITELLPKNVWISNFNCPGQVVISGEASGIPLAKEILISHGAKKIISLDVAGAFHTPFMKSAQERLKPHLLSTTLVDDDSISRLVMNVSGDFVDSSAMVYEHLISQIVSPVKWEKGIKAIDREGVDVYIEIGPGKTLSGMNKKMAVLGKNFSIEKVADLQQLECHYAAC